MKYLVKIFVVTFLLLICTYASAEQKVAFMDLKFILNNSTAGKGALGKITEQIKENQKKISSKEEELKKEEAELLATKKVLTKEDYKKKTNELRAKVIEYQKERKKTQGVLNRTYAEAKQALINKIGPIVETYMVENEISLVIDKKNIIGGKVDLDITDIIIKKVNTEFPSLNLK